MIEVRDYDQTPADGAVRTRFVYDSQGRRVQKLNESYDLSTDLWTATSDLRYFYDGWNLLFEIDTLSTEPTRYYVWGHDLSGSAGLSRPGVGAGGIGGLLFTKSGSETHAVSYDANGNVSEYIDLADGSVDAHLEYDAFGRTIASSGTTPAPFGFSTKYQDAETGYYYYGFRYYDPETGRWPNRDPIEEQGGWNIYGFAYNNSISFYDPDGRAIETGWDIFNVATGFVEFGVCVATGDAVGAALSLGGVTLDIGATLIPGVPGGASSLLQARRAGKIAKATRVTIVTSKRWHRVMRNALRTTDAAQDGKHVIRYMVRKNLDEAHHIIPRNGPPASWFRNLTSGGVARQTRRQLDQVRDRLDDLGIDIDLELANLVSLDKKWHRNNTLNLDYYLEVIRKFPPYKTRTAADV